MSETTAGARPSQVTMAGGLAVLGSALLVLTIFESISRLQSVEMRESIAEFLAKPPGDGMGIGVPEALNLLRATMLVTGAVAAAATVLGVFVLLRHNAARVCFTVAAAIMLLTAPVSGGVLPVLVAFSATMLWTRPARDWFAGRVPVPAQAQYDQPPAQTPADTPEPSRPDAQEPSRPDEQWPAPDQGGPAETPAPRPTHGFGSPAASQPSPYTLTPAAPYGQPSQPTGFPGYPVQQPSPDKRPVSVTIAAAVTWAFAGATGLVYAVVIAMLFVAKDHLVTLLQDDSRFRDLNISTEDLMAALWVMSAVVIVWCLASMVLAYLAFRRQNWARITLVVSALMSVLVGVAALPFSLLHMAAGVVTVVLLFAGGTNSWFAGPKVPGPQQPYQPPAGEPKSEKEPPTNVW